jgi:hypothetical protein
VTKIVQNLDRLNEVTASGLNLFENRLINPLFQVDIEGNAAGVTTSGKHVVEGWITLFNNDVTAQTTSRVTGNSVPYALRYTVTTGSDTSITTGQYAAIMTAAEGYDISDAMWGTSDAKSVWVSGRIKAPTTGTYCVALENAGNDRSYVFEVSCTAGTWVNFEKEIPGDTSGTWDKTNGRGLLVVFTIAASSASHTTSDTWAAGDFIATSNQENGLATNGNAYEIEDIRVSVSKPIKTEWRPYALDLAHCERYYESQALFVTTSSKAGTWRKQKRATPTASGGGGAGFTTSGVLTQDAFSYLQTTPAYQTIYGNARLI